MSAQVFNPSDPEQLRRGLRQARLAVAAGQVVLLPTDSRYALVTDGLSAAGLESLRLAKGWEETPILQLLLPGQQALAALAAEVHPVVEALAEAFWPGPLSMVMEVSRTLKWNLGEHVEAVGFLMSSHPVATALLEETGPLLISGAGSGSPHAGSAEEFVDQAAGRVAVALIDPLVQWDISAPASTVVDTRGLSSATPSLAVIRAGAVGQPDMAAVVGPDVAWSDTAR